MRILGLYLLIAAWILSTTWGESQELSRLPPHVSLILILAVGIRIGVIPFNLHYPTEDNFKHGLDKLFCLIPAAASYVLLIRISENGFPSLMRIFLLIYVFLIGIIAGLHLLNSKNESSRLAFWTITISTLVIASSIQTQPTAGQAWSIAGILAGGLIFLSPIRNKRLIPLLLLGLLAISTLPFTPAWSGVQLYKELFSPLVGLFLLVQALLLIGYSQSIKKGGLSSSFNETWMWMIYLWGLIMIVLTDILIAFWEYSSISRTEIPILVLNSWPSLAACCLAVVLYLLMNRGLRISLNISNRIGYIISFKWLISPLRAFYRAVTQLVTFSSNLLEGHGGVLWAFLFLTLLFSILIQFQLGG
jgi:hypothetical protein